MCLLSLLRTLLHCSSLSCRLSSHTTRESAYGALRTSPSLRIGATDLLATLRSA